MLPKTEQPMAGGALLSVTHFHRWRGPRHFSIERLFSDVRGALPTGISCRVATSRFESRGVLKRIYNMLEASRRQTQVNHVTGDTHYLTLLMSRRSTVLTIPTVFASISSPGGAGPCFACCGSSCQSGGRRW